MELLLEALLQLMTPVVGWTGRGIVRVVSFGTCECESLFGKSSGVTAPAGALTYLRGQRLVVTATGQVVLGTLFYVLLGLVAYWKYCR